MWSVRKGKSEEQPRDCSEGTTEGIMSRYLTNDEEKALRDRGICPDPPLARYQPLNYHGVDVCGNPMNPGSLRCERCAHDFRVETFQARGMVGSVKGGW